MPKGKKKIIEEPVMEEPIEELTVSKSQELLQLLKAKTPTIFDKEPSPAFNSNLGKLVEEIINLFE